MTFRASARTMASFSPASRQSARMTRLENTRRYCRIDYCRREFIKPASCRELPAMLGRHHYSVQGEIEIGLRCANIRLPGATKNEGLGLYAERHLSVMVGR